MAGNPAAPYAARPLGFVCFVSVEVAPRRPGANDDRLRLFIVLLAHAFPMKALRDLAAMAAIRWWTFMLWGFARGAERLRSGAASRAGSV